QTFQPAARQLMHGRVLVEPDHVAARPDALGDEPRVAAGPDRGIDPDLARPRVEQREDLAGQDRHVPRRLRGHTAAGQGGQGGVGARYSATKTRYAVAAEPTMAAP